MRELKWEGRRSAGCIKFKTHREKELERKGKIRR